MRFHFTAFNHGTPWRDTLADMFNWLRAGLEECGHEVTYSADSPDPSALNIVWEAFTPETGAELTRSGLAYGLIVTEFMDGEGFNHGTPMSGQADRRDGAYRNRSEGFQAAARGARFFWSMVESNLPPLRTMAPASFVELGFSPRLVPSSLPEPNLDFSFTGILTPYRRQVLESMSAKARVVWQPALLSLADRDALMAATRINLSINKTRDWQMPSPTRVGLALHLQRGVALDRTPQMTRQSRLVDVCEESRAFDDFALDLLSGDWRTKAKEALERFRAEMPMRDIVVRLLDESLGPASF